jgi:hypothetical protein
LSVMENPGIVDEKATDIRLSRPPKGSGKRNRMSLVGRIPAETRGGVRAT